MLYLCDMFDNGESMRLQLKGTLYVGHSPEKVALLFPKGYLKAQDVITNDMRYGKDFHIDEIRVLMMDLEGELKAYDLCICRLIGNMVRDLEATDTTPGRVFYKLMASVGEFDPQISTCCPPPTIT